MAEPTPLRRRWFQFSLATMFVVVTLIGVSLAVLLHRAREHERAIAFFRKMGAGFVFDYQHASGHYRSDVVPPGSPWLKQLLGEYYRSNVYQLELFAERRTTAPEKLTDNEAYLIATFTEADWLVLRDTRMTDAGLKHLYKLKRLGRLDLEGTKVTPSGVESLQRQLPNLKIYYDGME